MNTIKSFIRNEYSKELGVNIFVPFDLEVIKKLFGWLSTNTSLTVRGRSQKNAEVEETSEIENDDIYAQSSATMSTSGMQGFKSALSWFYKENEAVMDASINEWIDTFMKGYKKSVAEKKSRGIMKIRESLVLMIKFVKRTFSYESLLSFLGYVI
jgi:hypothetical protein